MTDDRGDCLVELGRRVLSGEQIDWDKEEIAESEVREGMKRLQKIVGSPAGTETAVGPPSPKSKDCSIGPFRLVRKLGEGGMGVVYEAEQQHPHRGVALKVIRGGRHVDDHTLRLFQREIHTLARLGHPGIAQLYEAGVTDDGMHYFAMELVRGVPLSEWLRKRSDRPVTPAELRIRIGLFRRICDAVAYAHQKGVIHRDLKPANILIPTAKAGSPLQDATPEIKILDFGLARMTDTDVQMTTFHTEMGKVQGTLPYMSPEQIRGNPDEIDLRTDVYSLGVILYELVTGRLPLDVSKAQLGEAMRIICEDAPRSLTTTFQGTKRLDADIATIAGKCLEKETARRYQSAAALAEDVQRYLTDQPIQARPPSAAYQFRKLVRRHKGPFAVAAGAFTLLLAFSVVMSVQAARIARERDRANQERDRANTEAETASRVSDFLEELFKVADPSESRGETITAKEILDRGAERIERELSDKPAIQSRLMTTIGGTYRGLGLPARSVPLLERAAALVKSLHGEQSLEYADALNDLGGLGNSSRAHEIRLQQFRPDDPRMAASFYGLGVAQAGSDAPEAEANLQRALDLVEHAAPPDERLHLWILNDLAGVHAQRKDLRGAVELYRKALEIRERIYPPLHPDRNLGMNNLGYLLLLAGERQEARYYLENALRANERTFGPEHPQVGMTLQSMGELERQEGRYDVARRLLERSLKIFEARMDTLDPIWNETLVSLGLLEETEGRLDEAIRHLSRARQIYHHRPGTAPGDPSADLVRTLRKAGKLHEAEQVERSSRLHEPRMVK